MRLVAPTLHVGTRRQVRALAHLALVYMVEAGEAARAVDAGRRAGVPSEEVGRQVLEARGIDLDSLPRWDTIGPDEPIPLAP